MPELDADFEISTNNLEAEYEITQSEHFDCSFEIYASGTTWGSITGNIEEQTDLQDILSDLQSNIDDVADDLSIETDNRQTADTDLQDNIDTVDGKIDTHISDKSNPHEVTKTQVGLGNVDNTSDLNKPISTATQTALNGKQNTINDLATIRTNASNGQSAYNTIQNYGDIVTYDASSFATSVQGQKADTALQPNDNISELNNDAGYITSASLPTVNNSTITFQKNNVTVGDINLNQPNNETINFNIPTTASDVNALPDTTTINDLTTTAQQNAIDSGANTSNIGQIATNTSNISSLSTTVTNNYNTLDDRITSEVSTLNSSIGTETTNRQNADNNLQSQIDAIVIGNGTLTIQNNSVDVDTFNANATSNKTINIVTPTKTSDLTNDSGFIDSSALSGLATQTDLTNGLATKQDTISDLSTIRSNAANGQSAYTTIGGYGDIVTYNASNFIQKNGDSSTQTISLTSGTGTTALGIKSMATSSYISLSGSSGWLGSFGVTSNKRPAFYNGTGYTLAYTSEIPTNTSELINDSGFITGIGSNDVITALGYTPASNSAFTGADGTNAGSSGLVPAPSATDNDKYLKGDGTWASVSGGSSTDVQINGTSITSSGVANIVTNTAYNASSNKIATMSDLLSSGANTDLSNLTATGEAHFQKPLVSGTNIKTINNTSLLGSGDISVGSYSAGTGLSLSGTTFNHSNSVTAGTIGTSSATSGSTISVPYANYDAQGHITGKGTHTHTVTGFLTSSSTQVASSRFDGQWVASFSSHSWTAKGSYTISLSGYLPSNRTSYSYYIYVVAAAARGSSNGNYRVGTVASPVTNEATAGNYSIGGFLSSNSTGWYSSAIIPVAPGGNLYSELTAAMSNAYCYLIGYRRIGTNT